MSTPQLAFDREEFVDERAFAKDKLNREQLADKLTGYIDRLSAGAVLAIDAPWGEGKTWFGRNWAKKLEDDGYKIAYIDTFEQDYIDDPFVLLASELLTVTDERSQAKMQLTKKAVNVVKATLSIGTKIGAGLATKYFLGGVDLGDEIESAMSDASKETANISSEWVEKSFTEYEQNKRTIEAFKEELTKFASSQEKPVVIFVDELDRCKPDFAIRLIERIKHFFDVPNVIFVLLLNREQLEKAVKGVYGSETDGAAYLGKFVNFFFKLPAVQPGDLINERYVQSFVIETFKKYRFPSLQSGGSDIVKTFTFLSIQFGLSLRDIERAVALYALAYPAEQLDWLLTYFIVLKQKEPGLYQRLINDDIESHKKMSQRLDKLLQIDEDNGGNNNRLLSICKELHEAHISNFTNIGENLEGIYQHMSQMRFGFKHKDVFNFFVKQLDLRMEN